MSEINPLQMAMKLAALAATIDRVERAALDRAAKLVEKDAKRQLGRYQGEVGPFQDWEELADSTKADRVRKGYTEDDPGLRSGAMRESISRQVIGKDAAIGSVMDEMLYFEIGTEKQPPRPTLGPAVFKNKEKIQEILGSAVASGLVGGDAIHPALGYDAKL